MSPLQLVLVGTVMEAAIFLFEIPTGVVADTFGRRRSIVVSFLIQGGATILLGSVPSFPVIAAAWALWGFGYTFQSGAYEAWITDEVVRAPSGPSSCAPPGSRTRAAPSGSARASRSASGASRRR
jgi:MFS family permease